MDINTFPERLRESRLKKKLNFKELAEISGVTATAISYYEKGAKTPQLDNAAKLAIALGVSLDWLCGIDTPVSGDNDNTALLRSLISVLERFIYSWENTGEIFILSFVFNEINEEIVKFIDEFTTIDKLKSTSEVVTEEMYNTLINALIEKYKSIPVDNLAFSKGGEDNGKHQSEEE